MDYEDLKWSRKEMEEAMDKILEIANRAGTTINETNKIGGIAIDTETTGLDSSTDEILQVSIVNEDGNLLFNRYFKPCRHTEWPNAEKVNHISPEMVKNCPYIYIATGEISRILASAKKIIGYNTPFDLKFLKAAGVVVPDDVEIVDVMKMFSEVKGDWDEVHGGFKWQKLTDCAEYCGYEWDGAAHDSLRDARATMYCYKQLSHTYADLRERLAAYESTEITPGNVCVLKGKSIKALTADIHQNAIDHGWWEGERTFGELIALCHSELSEALEEYRNGHKPNETYFNEGKPNKPEGIPTELADCVIRILDMCGHYGIDIEKAILDKHECNISRPYKHGGKVI